eukprot:CAMPEP_0119561340 /NCGR_PEP_ID=MMETSP1352-20130426/17281_1 /TAXON_ID=265584 /ORGANISM="Stauroneis constricta, Strain CCMP1120" /LENGTH=170 /DNA_ID=CAMNT_0007609517 /DNA_START=45 /DNA_END=557 /DNA_ORIENTATION=+
MVFQLAIRKAVAGSLQRHGRRALSAAATTTTSDAPSVFDKLVTLTIVDPSGARRKIPGLVGTTLYEACETNEVELGPCTICGPSEIIRSDDWTEPVFGDGPTSGYDHVVLSGAGVDTAAPMTRSEERMIEHYWDFDEIFPESRLASMIKLTKAMNGMIVYVPPRLDDTNP